MPKFLYVGDDERDFPDACLTVAPGDVVDRDTNPHPRYFVPATKPAVVETAEE
jgi:hypothetical protein